MTGTEKVKVVSPYRHEDLRDSNDYRENKFQNSNGKRGSSISSGSEGRSS